MMMMMQQQQQQQQKAGQEPQKPNGPTPAQKVSTEAEKYEEVNPSELSFKIMDYNYHAVVAPGGGARPIGGHIGALLCEGQPLELSSDKFEGGFIITKNYGKIKVTFGASLYNSSFSIYLTPEQKKALLVLKKK